MSNVVLSIRYYICIGVQPLACIHHISVMGHDPVIMLEAPLPATDRALRRAGLTIDDIDLFEINEAFASVPMAWLKHTKADPSKLNVNGGAIALGHPLGNVIIHSFFIVDAALLIDFLSETF